MEKQNVVEPENNDFITSGDIVYDLLRMFLEEVYRIMNGQKRGCAPQDLLALVEMIKSRRPTPEPGYCHGCGNQEFIWSKRCRLKMMSGAIKAPSRRASRKPELPGSRALGLIRDWMIPAIDNALLKHQSHRLNMERAYWVNQLQMLEDMNNERLMKSSHPEISRLLCSFSGPTPEQVKTRIREICS